MRTLEGFIAAAAALIALALILRSGGGSIGAVGNGVAGIIKTLQGK